MTARRVWVPSAPLVRDPRTRERVAKFDMTPAEKFGEIVFVFEGDDLPSDPAAMVDAAWQRLDCGPEDHVMLAGDPVAIALVAVVAARQGGGVLRLLKWVSKFRGYVSMRLETGA